MTSSRKKPGVAFWATVVVVVLLIGYPLSGGIYEYFMRRGQIPSWLDGRLEWYFAPMRWLYQNGPQWYRDAIHWFVARCGP